MSRHALLKAARLVHLYVGVFIAPALIFFAFTGAIQTFGLHETNRDHPTYVPARWLVVLGQIHKKQTPIVPVRKPQPPASAAPSESSRDKAEHRDGSADKEAIKPAAPAAAPQKQPKPLPLRIFFLIVAVGLFTSTVTGLYMSYKFNRNKALITATLVAGLVIPLLLTLL